MHEGFEEVSSQFLYPNILSEIGEFERVAREKNLDKDVLLFLAKEEGRLIELKDEVWQNLENTDSNRFEKNDWEAVQEYSLNRDWRDLKKKIESNIQLDAPIVMKYEDSYHLVSGNTRLMVARALGITPQVLMFEYKHNRLDEEV